MNQSKNTFTILSLAFGILSIITGCFCIGGLFGILGIVFYVLSRKAVGTTNMNIAGLVTSIIGTILAIFMLIFILLIPSSDKKTTENTTESITTEAETTEATTTETITTESVTTEPITTESSTEPENTLPNTIESDLSDLFDSVIDDSYKTNAYYCDISPTIEYDGEIVSVQIESNSFVDENICKTVVTDIISKVLVSDNYQYIDSIEFAMLTDWQIQYMCSIESAQDITDGSDIESKLKIQATSTSETTTEESTTAAPAEPQVWIPSSGSKYHSKSSCSNMNNPKQVSKSEAESMGYTPCKRCY